MDEPYLGEIRPIGFGYAPKGWAFCNGQTLAISQNQALFSLLGTQFGGDGTTNFRLPDLRSRLPLGAGQLAGGSNYPQGQAGGQEQVSLSTAQLPAHTHSFTGTLQTSNTAEFTSPVGALPAVGGPSQYATGGAPTSMGAAVAGNTTTAGASQGHENRPPFLALNYVIAVQGTYPPRQ